MSLDNYVLHVMLELRSAELRVNLLNIISCVQILCRKLCGNH